MGVPTFLPISEARSQLNRIAAAFEAGDREPVFFGAHRKPVGVIMSADAYTELLDLLDDYAIAAGVRERLDGDTGERVGFDDLAAAVDIDPATFDK